MPPSASELVELLELVGLPHKMNMKPLDLSAGEQQRVAIARALDQQARDRARRRAHRQPRLGEQHLILDLFRDLNQRLRQTIVMITHNLEAAAVAHRIIEMKDGRVREPRDPAAARDGRGT